jgi:hypothetical protein
MRPRSAVLAAAAAALLLLGLAVLLILRDDALPLPAGTPGPAVLAAPSAIVEVRAAATSQPAVVVGGVGVVGEPVKGSSAVTVQSASGETRQGRAVSSGLHGLAITADVGAALSSLQMGSSSSLRPDEGVFFVASLPGATPVPATYRGQTDAPTGDPTQGHRLVVLDFALAEGPQPIAGVVLDRRGLLVGVATADRQQHAPAGHVYAVPVEWVADLLERMRSGQGLPYDPADAAPDDE